MGSLLSTLVGVVAALGVIAAVFIGLNVALNAASQRMEERLRPWLFVGPAMLFLIVALIVPAIRTIVLSFRGGDRGDEGFTLSTWTDRLTDDDVISFERVGDIFTSRLFLVSIVLLAVGLGLGARAGRASGVGAADRRRSIDASNPVVSILLVAAVVGALMAVFSTLRGVIWNNLWWVVVVAGLATLFGLALAVLADRSRKETAAKTFIFMPMAISLVGAAVIFKYLYDTPGAGQSEGLLNILWPGGPIDFLRGSTPSGTMAPWNNFFIMVIMIWIQTGFAMVVLSAAIKGVSADLLEAARVDGANEAQVFWRITLPQIRSTVIVVITTLTITVLKIFDLVKATTGGAADTDVLANRMVDELRNGNFTQSSSFAVMILVLVLPVMYLNVRRARQEAAR
ncbi:MAG: carbohydrate ABC transporter permease [Actinomycetota bacterium]